MAFSLQGVNVEGWAAHSLADPARGKPIANSLITRETWYDQTCVVVCIIGIQPAEVASDGLEEAKRCVRRQ